jgi:acetyl-CoA C-acetyltransferase
VTGAFPPNGPIWLLGGVRTPFGKFCGALRDVPLLDLGAHVVNALLDQYEWDRGSIAEMNVGIAMIEGGLIVPARQIALRAGLPDELPTLTVDRACCSGMTATGIGIRSLRDGASVVVALGIESMSRTPRLLHETRWGSKRGDMVVEDLLLMRSPAAGTSIATYAGREALARGVGRDEQDAWAMRSQQRYFAAAQEGYFDGELVPITTPIGELTHDEQPRPDVTLERLSRLPTVYDSPTVTAGNAPGLNDGACALLLGDSRAVERASAEPIARIHAYTAISGGVTSAVYLPGQAIAKLLDEAGLAPADLDVIEINEAFAATAVTSVRTLADGDPGLETELREKTNANGGAVAIGHPTGASGARILLTAARELQRRGGRWGAAAICGGFGQADAVLLERVAG